MAKVRPSLLLVAVASLGVIAGVLAVVGLDHVRSPPPALAAICAPEAIHIHSDSAMFQVLISPGTIGTDSFVLQLMAGDASPLLAKQATLTLSPPERGLDPLERMAALGADGYWHVSDVPIPQSGRWHVRVDAVTNLQNITLEDDFEVPAR